MGSGRGDRNQRYAGGSPSATFDQLQWGPVVVTGISYPDTGATNYTKLASMGSGRGDRNQNIGSNGPPTDFVASTGSGRGDRNQRTAAAMGVDVSYRFNGVRSW